MGGAGKVALAYNCSIGRLKKEDCAFEVSLGHRITSQNKTKTKNKKCK